METNFIRGRNLILLFICMNLGIQVIEIILMIVTQGSQGLLLEIIRFLIALVFSILLYKGSDWVRILTALVLCISAIFGIVTLMNITSLTIDIVYVMVYTAFAGSWGIILFRSPSVKAFITNRKMLRQ